MATVTLGSSEIVALAGGPQPWILDPNGFYESCKLAVARLASRRLHNEWKTKQNLSRNSLKQMRRKTVISLFMKRMLLETNQESWSSSSGAFCSQQIGCHRFPVLPLLCVPCGFGIAHASPLLDVIEPR